MTWSTLLTVRMPAILRFDQWLQTLPDPTVVATDLSQATKLAAAFRAWDSIPANRMRDTRRVRTDRVDVLKLNASSTWPP